MIRPTLIALSLISASVALPAHADYLYGFGGVYVDHQNWDHGPTSIEYNNGGDVADRNQLVLGVEGGAGFTWGDVYGFFDYESPGKGANDRKTSFKGSTHIYLGDSGLSAYAQVYDHQSQGMDEQNRVLGIGYTKLAGDNWWFKPWVGIHDVDYSDSFSATGTRINGSNGYMLGWTAGYRFQAFNQNFTLVNWNEVEFDRKGSYATINGGDTGVNGAISLMWNANEHITTGLSYRYFANKLGVNNPATDNQTYGDALIYRLQYNF
jgi:hypothetical protein